MMLILIFLCLVSIGFVTVFRVFRFVIVCLLSFGFGVIVVFSRCSAVLVRIAFGVIITF